VVDLEPRKLAQQAQVAPSPATLLWVLEPSRLVALSLEVHNQGQVNLRSHTADTARTADRTAVSIHELMACYGHWSSSCAGASRGQSDRNDNHIHSDTCPLERSSIDYIAQQSAQGNLRRANQRE
jgi:hypothetical protein